MTLPRNWFSILVALTVCALAIGYVVKHYSPHPDIFNNIVVEQKKILQTKPDESNNPFALVDHSEINVSTTKHSTAESRETPALSTKQDITQSLQNDNLPDCGLYCQQTIDVLKLPYAIADHEYEEHLAVADQLAAYLQANSQLRDEFVEIAVQAEGNKRKIIIAAFALLPEGDRVKLGQALITSNSEYHRLDGIHLLASTESANQHWVSDFTELLINEQSGYVRQSVVQALNRPEMFKGNAEVLAVLSQVLQTEGDASVRGEALLVSARLSSDPQPLLYDSFNAIRSEQSDYQEYGVRAMEEIFVRHTRRGGQISEVDRNQLDQLVSDLMEPEFDNMPIEVRRNIEDLFERFY